jgi:hypothetical protein
MGRPSSGDFRDQGRIVTAASPVHPPRYRPHAKAIFGGRSEQLRLAEVRAIEKRRHPAGNRPRESIRVRDDHGAGRHSFALVGAVLPVPETALLSTPRSPR